MDEHASVPSRDFMTFRAGPWFKVANSSISMKEMGLVSSCHSGCIKLSAKAFICFLVDHLLGLAQSIVLELRSLQTSRTSGGQTGKDREGRV